MIVMVRGGNSGLSMLNREINPSTFPQGTRDVKQNPRTVSFPLYFAYNRDECHKIAISS